MIGLTGNSMGSVMLGNIPAVSYVCNMDPTTIDCVDLNHDTASKKCNYYSIDSV